MNSKRKGKAAELEFSHMLKDFGFNARRGVQYSGGGGSPDVVCEELDHAIHWEVKAAEKLNIWDAVNQAIRDCPQGKWRAVAHKRNRKGWLITMTFEDYMDLLKEWYQLKKE